jgi:arylsulfatase A-like enzyme
MRNRYDNAVAYADRAAGRVLDHVRAIGAWDETAIVFLTDHGEAWGEHGLYGHGVDHFPEFLDVPLFVRVPGAEPGRDPRLATTIDVAPTLADLAGVAPHPSWQGRSLLDPAYRPRLQAAFSSHAGERWSLRIDDWKLTWRPATGEMRLSDLAQDPRELENLAFEAHHRDRVAALREMLRSIAEAQLARIERLRAEARRVAEVPPAAEGGPDGAPRHAQH